MMTKIARYITQMLLVASVIEEGDRELYQYGFFLLIAHCFYFLVTLMVGLLAGVPCESILFYMVFMLLRIYAGGVHANSETSCTILTTMALTLSVFGIRALYLANVDLVSGLVLAIGSFAIILFSPLDAKNKPLEFHEKRHYRVICNVLVLIFVMSAIVSRFLLFYMVYYPIVCGIGLVSFLLSIGKIHNLME